MYNPLIATCYPVSCSFLYDSFLSSGQCFFLVVAFLFFIKKEKTGRKI